VTDVADRPLDAKHYRHHRLHRSDRVWSETNCSVDLWVEVLHSRGYEPVAGLAFLLASDFDGAQWDFLKFPTADLWRLFGVDVAEINVWRPVAEHIAEHLALGHLTTVEVDAWFLPDTAGSSYRAQHRKTTIAPQMIDPVHQRLAYFHNRGYFELEGPDFHGALRVGAPLNGEMPYIERVRFDRAARLDGDELRAVSLDLAREHFARHRRDNPVSRLAERVGLDRSLLAAGGADTFHGYAFGTFRQLGAWAELLADYLAWLGGDPTGHAGTALLSLAEGAKTAQFKLARVVIGRSPGLDGLLAELAQRWAQFEESVQLGGE
jgi:hypothetical protein